MKLVVVILSKAKTIAKRIYRLIAIAPRLAKTAVYNPRYIPLSIWAFKQLWWVDGDLQTKAISALQTPVDASLAPLNLDLRKAIRERAIAILWISKIHPLRPKCLHRSLALYHWLLDRGISSKLEIGWGDNIGHAWITYDGIVLNDNSNVAESRIPFAKLQTEN